jgi:hypothetical protein
MAETADKRPVTVFGPDFPFPFDDWIKHPSGLARIPAARHGEEVAIIGAGASGMIALPQSSGRGFILDRHRSRKRDLLRRETVRPAADLPGSGRRLV